MRDTVVRYSDVVAVGQIGFTPKLHPTHPLMNPEPGYTIGRHLTESRGRADIQRGDHRNPTAYFAYRYTSRPSDILMVKRGGTETYYLPPFYNPEQTVRNTTYSGKQSYDMLYVADMFGLAGYEGFSPLVDQSIIDRCVNGALARVKRSETSLGATLGEISELKGMLIQPFLKAMAMFVNFLKSPTKFLTKAGFKVGAGRNVGDAYTIPAAFLTLELGWKPLLSEIFGIQEAIIKATDVGEPILRVTEVVDGVNMPRIFSNYTFSSPVEAGCQIGLVYGVDPGQWAVFRRLGLINPLSIAWELAPMSFVVDWFVNIGQFLDLLDAQFGTVFKHGYITKWTRASGTLRREGWTPDLSPIETWEVTSPPEWQVDSFAMERFPFAFAPLPRLQIGKGINSLYRGALTGSMYALQKLESKPNQPTLRISKRR